MYKQIANCIKKPVGYQRVCARVNVPIVSVINMSWERGGTTQYQHCDSAIGLRRQFKKTGGLNQL